MWRQVRSLRLLRDLWADSSLDTEATDLSILLPRLLAAASVASSAVREAALDCFAALPEAKHAHLSAKHLAEFTKALMEQRKAVLRDAGALIDMLSHSLAAERPGKGKSTDSR